MKRKSVMPTKNGIQLSYQRFVSLSVIARSTLVRRGNPFFWIATFRCALFAMTRLVAFYACFLFIFAACSPDEPVLSGFLDRPSDAVFVDRCNPYPASEEHPLQTASCVIIANPKIRQLRVFNASKGDFILAPNGYFPLAIAVGPNTERLAFAPDSSFVFALDTLESKIFVVSLLEEPPAKAFVVRETLVTKPKPSDIKAFKLNTNTLLLLVGLASQNAIEAIFIDAKSGKESGARFSVNLNFTPTKLAVDAKRMLVLAASATQTQLALIDMRTASATAPVAYVESGVFINDIAVGEFASGPVAVLLHNSFEFSLVQLNSPAKVLTKQPLTTLITTAYVANTQSQSCCANQKDWLILADAKGTLYRYLFANGVLKQESSEDLNKNKYLQSEEGLFFAQMPVKLTGAAIRNKAKYENQIFGCDNQTLFFFANGSAGKICEGEALSKIRSLITR